MKQFTQKLCGVLFIFPMMLWAQEEVEKTEEKELIIEWKMDGELPEEFNDKIMTIIEEELSNVSEDSDVKVFMLDGNELDFDKQEIELISMEDEDGNVKITKYVNGKEVPIEEGENLFLMDLDSFEGKFPEKMEKIQSLTKMLEKSTIDCKEIEEKLSKLEEAGGAENEFFNDINVIKEIDEDGVEKVRVFMNGEEVEDADFPVMEFDFSDEKLFPQGDDVQMIVIRKEIFIDTIGDDDETPKNLKISKEPLELEEINMFPNPSNGKFTLKMQSESDAKVSVRILDVEGKTVYNQKLKPSGGLCTQEIDISGEAKGMYFLNIEQKGKYLSRKIIVQ